MLWRITILIVSLLAACRPDTPVERFQRTIGAYDFTDRSLCIGNDTPAYIAEYNAALLSGLAGLLAEGIEPAHIEATVADYTTARVSAWRADYALAEVWLRRCRGGSHDSRLTIPSIVVFDREGHHWWVDSGTIGSEPGWADGRWYFVSTWVNAMPGSPDSLRLLHIVQTGTDWEAQQFVDLPHGPALFWALGSSGAVEFVDDWHKIRVYMTKPNLMPNSPPCDLDLGEDVTYINTIYTGTLTLIWTGEAYWLTDETPFEAQIKAQRGGDAVVINDWRDYCM